MRDGCDHCNDSAAILRRNQKIAPELKALHQHGQRGPLLLHSTCPVRFIHVAKAMPAPTKSP